MELPDPMRFIRGLSAILNDDLAGMNRLELRRAWNAAEANLLLLGDNDLILLSSMTAARLLQGPTCWADWQLSKRLWKGVA